MSSLSSKTKKQRPLRDPAKPTVSLQIRMDPALMLKFIDHVKARGMSRTEWITLAIQEAVK
jgi:hypothetical protein